MTKLSLKDLERYDRQIRIDGFGESGQKKLKEVKIVIIGAGGLGCPVSIYLTAAGIGNITIIDNERIELSNLNRQILHWEKDIGGSKVHSVVKKLQELNQDIQIKGKITELTEKNAHSLIKGNDIVIDALDNFKTRFSVNRVCVDLKIPFIHAAVYGFEGRVMTIVPNEGPCLRCLIPKDPPAITPFPVLGATPAVIASLQAMEVIKLVTGIGELLVGKLLLFDGFYMSFDYLSVLKANDCPVCGKIK